MSESAAPFFYIIFPTFNQEKYLKTSVDAMRKQSFTDWKLLIVDDASADRTLSLARELAKSDPRISVLARAENGGPALTRNSGLEKADGNYVLFLDPDDWFEADLLERLHHAIQNAPAPVDMLVYGLIEEYVNEKGTIESTKVIVPENGWFDRPETIAREALKLEQRTLFGYPWNKCYRRGLLEQSRVQFENVKMIEDVTFNLALLSSIRTLQTLPYAGYHYEIRMRGDSVTHQTLPDYFPLHVRRIQLFLDWYRKRQPGMLDECRHAMAAIYLRFLLSAIGRSAQNPGESAEQRKQWLRQVFDSRLFDELALYMNFESLPKKIIFSPLVHRQVSLSLFYGGVIGRIRSAMPGLFARLKQIR